MSKKDAYIEKAQAKIEEYACKLDELKAKAKGEVAGLKIELLEQIDKLAELTDSAEDKWEDLSTRFEVLADDLGTSFRKFFEKH